MGTNRSSTSIELTCMRIRSLRRSRASSIVKTNDAVFGLKSTTSEFSSIFEFSHDALMLNGILFDFDSGVTSESSVEKLPFKMSLPTSFWACGINTILRGVQQWIQRESLSKGLVSMVARATVLLALMLKN